MSFILRVMQGISMFRYSWGPRQVMLDSPASLPHKALNLSDGFPLAYGGARQVSLWGRRVWCRQPKSSVGFCEADIRGCHQPFCVML